MHEYGLIHQGVEPYDLVGLPFFPGNDSMVNHGAAIEVIQPEWIEDKVISASSGTISDATGFHYSITDVSDYTYVILPLCKSKDATSCTGLCNGAGTTIVSRINLTIPSASTETIVCYGIFLVDADNGKGYAAVSTFNTGNYPILGIKFPAS